VGEDVEYECERGERGGRERIMRADFANQISGVRVDIVGNLQFGRHFQMIHFLNVLIIEGRLHNNTERE
jgi:hypothetical protein